MPLTQGFMFYLLLSVIISGIFISGVTMLSERLGSRLGGMVSNLPSTLLVSLLFIGITQGEDFAAAATGTVPLGMILSTLFLFSFLVLIPKGLFLALAGSLLVWLAVALFSSLFQGVSRQVWTILYFFVAIGSWLLAEKKLKIPSVGRSSRPYSGMQILIRALFAGSVVGAAVLLARGGSAFWTGIFATFPAVMLSSMVILTLTAGPGFARGLGKIMLLASTNIVVYGYLAGIFFPKTGIWWGTLMAFAVSALWVFLLKPLFDKSL
ncbi:MAG TPA: hypothetical protein VLH37_10955 [Bacteroidales bacterium]|nr:hypothetical protein [Bacteroidales bacterium]